MTHVVSVAIVGAGPAGLMTAIRAAAGSDRSVVMLDGSRQPGTKILMAGGGRCNVTHREVGPGDFAGSSRNAIGKILRRFDVARTVAFFEEIGVPLVEEDTGKLFPVANQARVVRDALLAAAAEAGASLECPRRVETIVRSGDGFLVSGPWGDLRARRAVLATGGRSYPTTGSDGAGYDIARSLGIEVTDRIFPALAPLLVEEGHFVRDLSGITVPARLTLRSGTGKALTAFEGSTLCTHFGLSGPTAMNLSRYLADARVTDPAAAVTIDWRPDATREAVDLALRDLGPRHVLGRLRERLPERLARALCAWADVPADRRGDALTKKERRGLVRALKETAVPVTGDGGYSRAEATAGGVPLTELRLDSMESRRVPGLHLVGEICDVDGRIGGFNFQWAWSSGALAGRGAAAAPG